ncbi:MAG: hypothetical protein Alpg2KO_32270 [Alphaproteobacteria bacterium]
MGPLAITTKRLQDISAKPRAVQATDMTAEQADKAAKSRPFAKVREALNNVYAAAYVKAAQWAHLQQFVEPAVFMGYVGIEHLAAQVGSGILAKGATALATPETAAHLLKPGA